MVAHRRRPGRAGRRLAQVERRQLGVAAAGQDQRQRHRAVEQVGAARLAGALRRARTRRARRRAAGRPGRCGRRSARGRRRPRARPPSSAPIRQAASNRRGGLQPAALQVALGRSRRSTRRRRAASARRAPAPSRRARAPAPPPRCRWRPARRTRARTAGRRWRWRPRGRRELNTVGRPRRSSARSSTSSWTSVAMCSSSTATAAGSARARRRRAHRNTSSGRSRLPPADSVPAACALRSAPWPVGHLGQPALGAVHEARQLDAARLEHRRQLGAACSPRPSRGGGR